MGLKREDITWKLVVGVRPDIAKIRASMTEFWYDATREAIQTTIVDYINAVPDCLHKQGKTVSPIGQNPQGGKVLKVRCALPGMGKSGGLRIAVAAYCDERIVEVVYAHVRKDEPKVDDMLAAAER